MKIKSVHGHLYFTTVSLFLSRSLYIYRLFFSNVMSGDNKEKERYQFIGMQGR